MADTDGYESTGKPWTRDQWELKVIEMLQEEPDVTADERKATRPISPNCSTSRSLKSERLVRHREEKGAFASVEAVKRVAGVTAEPIDSKARDLEF